MQSLPSRGPPRIVLVDDEDLLSWCIATELEAKGYEVKRASSYQEGKLALAQATPDLVICDQGLPDGWGLDLLRQSLDPAAAVPVIMITAFTPPQASELAAVGARRCLTKPFDLATLKEEVEACLLRNNHFC